MDGHVGVNGGRRRNGRGAAAEARSRWQRRGFAAAEARVRGGRGADSRWARARGSQRVAEFAVGVGAARCGLGFAARRGVRGRGRGPGFAGAGAGAVRGSRARTRSGFAGAVGVRGHGRGREFVVGVERRSAGFAAEARSRRGLGFAVGARSEGTARWGRGQRWGHGAVDGGVTVIGWVAVGAGIGLVERK